MKTCPQNPSGSHKTSPVTPTRSAFENSDHTQTKLVATCPVDEPRTSLASVRARKSTLKTNYSTFLLSIICRTTHNIEKQENPSPHHSLVSHKSPPANFDLSQRLPQHSQRWCLIFLRHILLPHLKTNYSQEFRTLYLLPQLNSFLGSQPHTTRNHHCPGNPPS